MTDERRQNLDAVRAYVALLQPIMRLAHWDIIVEDEPPDSGEGSVWRSRNCFIARLRFADKHFADSPAEQCATIAHELIHLINADADEAVHDATEFLDPTSREWARERCQHAMERAVDALSRVLAPLLPPPPTEEG